MTPTHITNDGYPIGAEIESVQGVDANFIGVQDNISYTVRVYFAHNARLIPGIKPHHRRPSEFGGLEIASARPGDAVIPQVHGQVLRFVIIEGVPSSEC